MLDRIAILILLQILAVVSASSQANRLLHSSFDPGYVNTTVTGCRILGGMYPADSSSGAAVRLKSGAVPQLLLPRITITNKSDLQNSTIRAGDEISIRVAALDGAGDDAFQYVWTKNGSVVGQTAERVLKDVIEGDAKYVVTARRGYAEGRLVFANRDSLIVHVDDGAIRLLPAVLFFSGIAITSSSRACIQLTNASGGDLLLRAPRFIDGDSSRFRIVAAPESGALLRDGESEAVTIEFTPAEAGSYTANLILDYESQAELRSELLRLQGLGRPLPQPAVRCGIGLTAAPESARPGDTVAVRIDLSEMENFDPQITRGLRLSFQIDPRVLHLLDSPDPRFKLTSELLNLRSMKVTLEQNFTADQSEFCTEVFFLALLREAQHSDIIINNVNWFGQDVDVLQLHDTRFDLQTDRFLTIPTAGVAILGIRPNPARGAAEVEIEVHVAGRAELMLVDVFGRVVLKLDDRWYERGQYIVAADFGRTVSGAYSLVAKSNVVSNSINVVLLR